MGSRSRGSRGRNRSRRKKIMTEKKIFIALRILTALIFLIGLVGSVILYLESKSVGVAITLAIGILVVWGLIEALVFRKIALYLKREEKKIPS